MELQAAIQLISKASIQQDGPQQWADLGCGNGTFTRALAHLLPPGSSIYAVDRMPQKLSPSVDNVNVIFSRHDFENDPLPFQDLNGILLANALHYCRDATTVLQKLMQLQQPGEERFLIVEYDSNTANQWVPYPLSFEKIRNIFSALRFKHIEKLAEHPSLFRKEKIYACQVMR